METVPAWQWWTIVLCLALSSCFSACETAFLSLSHARVLRLLEERSWGTAALRLWASRPSAVLTSILIGNNLVNIGASALATDISRRLFPRQGVAIAVGVMTLVILTFGEITPKVMARRMAEVLAGPPSLLIAVLYWVTWPVTRLFYHGTNWLIRATGGDPAKEFVPVTADELELMVAWSAQEGQIGELSADLISRALALTRKTVRDVMVPRSQVVSLEVADGAGEVARVFNQYGHSRIPVYRGQMDQMAGIFHVKDLLAVPVERWGEFRLADHLRPLYFVPETAIVGAVFRQMQRRGVHMAVVVDEFGGVEGILTLEDILEELVGEIRDEYDQTALKVKQLPEGAFEISAQTPMEDLRELFPRMSLETTAKTVSGLILEETGRVPVPGEILEVSNLRFTILTGDERRLRKVKVEALPPDTAED